MARADTLAKGRRMHMSGQVHDPAGSAYTAYVEGETGWYWNTIVVNIDGALVIWRCDCIYGRTSLGMWVESGEMRPHCAHTESNYSKNVAAGSPY